jgi:hypothetical protein
VQLELSQRWLHYGVVSVNGVALTTYSFSFYFSLSLFPPFSVISTPYTLQIRKEGRQFILMLNLILILLIIIFSINFFFQFHPSILGWLGIEFHDFFRLFSIRISRSHGLGHRFDKFTEVYYDLFFFVFFVN